METVAEDINEGEKLGVKSQQKYSVDGRDLRESGVEDITLKEEVGDEEEPNACISHVDLTARRLPLRNKSGRITK